MDKKLGVIVPYRDRFEHLQTFKKKIIPYLNEKGIDFELIVVEQDDGKAFNRGKLLNVGFLYAKKNKCDYVAFHDVDMIPVDVDYSYSDVPVQMATDFIGETKRIVFDEYFGGVTIFPVTMFEHINGYSNDYWGWGYEDTHLNSMELTHMFEVRISSKKERSLPSLFHSFLMSLFVTTKKWMTNIPYSQLRGMISR